MLRFFKNLYDRFLKLGYFSKICIVTFLVLFLIYVFTLPSKLFEVPYTTTVLDNEGNLLGARIATDGQWRFPISEEIPDKYKTCVIQFEDRYFLYHPGVNPFAMGRALYQNIKEGRIVSGGSTITMQTVRLMRKNKQRTYFEKFVEIILSTRLELKYSKKSILALYASHAPMGGNTVGIEAAAYRYFGHNSNMLSWAEAATLAVLPNSPSLMHFGKNRDKLLTKRNKLLKTLLDREYISNDDYQLAISEPLPDEPQNMPQIAPHLLITSYKKYPGKTTKTTIDKHLQINADEILKRWNDEFAQNDIMNIASLIVDVEKNEVLAYNGNVDFFSNVASNQVDIIFSDRSTGSILKPFLYCAMLQEGKLLPDEIIADVPINIGGFAPKNFNLQYQGAVAASDALARSLNVPAVVALRKYGIINFYQLLKKSGMTTLNNPASHYGLSLILGGAEGKLWEVANIYAHMAKNLNNYNKHKKYFENIDFTWEYSDKETKNTPTDYPLYNAGAIWATFETLTNLNRPEEIDWQFIPSIRKIAWKTGTSYGYRDGWSVGVTPKYLVAVWVGNASGEGRPGLTGARTAARVMFDLFNILPYTSWFDIPYQELTEAEICSTSGHLKGLNCPESSVVKKFIPKKGINTETCPYHRKIHVSNDEKYMVYENCAGSRGIKPVSWFVLPPIWEWYYKQHNPNYKSLPPYSPECSKSDYKQVMEFIYPFPNSKIKLQKQMDGSKGKVILEIAHRNPQSTIYWHLNDMFLGETTDIHQFEISPDKGKHKLTVVDSEGNFNSTNFIIE
ncbi:MAG: penicillin-binding protein 1C [Bacteroidales bacterium]|jgi:penicillin-binding protein 1C